MGILRLNKINKNFRSDEEKICKIFYLLLHETIQDFYHPVKILNYHNKISSNCLKT
jgi:hypothetical protein